MAKIQKRRSVSIKRRYYDALMIHATRLGIPAVRIVESLLYVELHDVGLLTDEDKKSSTNGKYWDPERKRWRTPAVNSRLNT